jgi:hypothetical protein
MNVLARPIGIILLGLLLGHFTVVACSSPKLKIQNPNELCATGVALSSVVQTQAAKLGIEPLELARKFCEPAFLAAKLAEVNLAKPSGIAGATSSAIGASMALAGAAGSGG